MILAFDKYPSFRLATGMNWSYAGSKGEVKDLLKSVGKQHLTKLTNQQGESWIGTYSEPVTKAYAAAALLGLVVSNAVIATTVGDGTAWVCLIREGSPAPGHDVLIPVADLRKTATGFMSLIDSPKLYGDIAGAECSVEALLARLQERIASKDINAKQLKSRLLVRQTISLVPIAVTVLIGGLAVLLFFGVQQYRREENRKLSLLKIAEKAAMSRAESDRLAEARRQKIADFTQLVQARRAEFDMQLDGGRTMPFWQAVTALRVSLPASTAGGYVPTGMACTKDACSVTWEAKGKFTRLMDKTELTREPVRDVSKTEVTNYPIAVAQDGEVKGVVNSDQLWPLLTDRFALVTGVVIEDAKPLVLTPPPDLGLVPASLGKTGLIKASFSGPTALLSADGFMRALNQYPAAITSLKVTGMFSQLTLVIEANYHMAAR